MARGLRAHVLSALALLIAAAPAWAQQVYQLTGAAVIGNGAYVADLPLIGEAPCPSLRVGHRWGSYPPPTPTEPTHTARPLGCAPGGPATVTAAGGTGASFSLPADFFHQPLPPGGANVVTVPINPSILQLATSVAVGGPAAPRVFRADAHLGQSGRAGADFTWFRAGLAGSHAIVRYSAGPNRFGGTMSLLLAAGPQESSLAQKVGGGVAFHIVTRSGPQAVGAGYAQATMNPSRPGQLWAMYTATSMGAFQPMTYVGPLPSFVESQVGFPWTTGTVLVRRVQSNYAHTLTAMGADSLTPGGARNVALVAGGLVVGTFGTSPQMGLMRLPEPAGFPVLAAGAAALLAGTAWRRRRVRSAG